VKSNRAGVRDDRVIAYAVVDPVFKPRSGHLSDEVRQLAEKIRQSGAGKCGMVAMDRTGGTVHEVNGQVKVVLHLLLSLQAPRHNR
jgi:hypothetical protein